MEQQGSHKSLLNKFSVAIVATLVVGLVGAIVLLQQRQDQRSRADTAAVLTIWAADSVPALASHDDPQPVELGLKFRPLISGTITGIRFYKGPTNTGTHIGNLWSSTGTLLATATFTNETASGWQQVAFATPVPVTANTTYVASYFTSTGNYSYNRPYFNERVTNGPLVALADGEAGGNGVYKYASSSAFPTDTFKLTNYWVDINFVVAASQAPTVQPTTASCSAVSVPATSDPWLAGMPDGSTASHYSPANNPDVAPAQSPVLVNLPLTSDMKLIFRNVSGAVAHGPTFPLLGAYGGSLSAHATGAENGIASLTAPGDSLIGIFLGPEAPNVGTVPAALDFTVNRDYLTLSPLMKQPFYIGEGKNSAGVLREITVPAGATRLFLATMDGHQWYNNRGSFSLDVCKPEEKPTTIALNLSLHGVGSGGDSSNPKGGNANPLHPQRTATVEVYDSQNQLTASKQTTVSLASPSGKFIGTVEIPNIKTGLFTVKVKLDQYLRTLIPGIQSLTAGQVNQLSPISLVVGDINGDNMLNILDYNILMGCYSDILPAANCSEANKLLADLDDDGKVNQYDYNLFLRELQNQSGQ